MSRPVEQGGAQQAPWAGPQRKRSAGPKAAHWTWKGGVFFLPLQEAIAAIGVVELARRPTGSTAIGIAELARRLAGITAIGTAELARRLAGITAIGIAELARSWPGQQPLASRSLHGGWPG